MIKQTKKIQTVKATMNELSATSQHRSNIIEGLDLQIKNLQTSVSSLASAMHRLRSLETVAQLARDSLLITESMDREIQEASTKTGSLYFWLGLLVVLEAIGVLAFTYYKNRPKGKHAL